VEQIKNGGENVKMMEEGGDMEPRILSVKLTLM
jgi:hypothetical protein